MGSARLAPTVGSPRRASALPAAFLPSNIFQPLSPSPFPSFFPPPLPQPATPTTHDFHLRTSRLGSSDLPLASSSPAFTPEVNGLRQQVVGQCRGSVGTHSPPNRDTREPPLLPHHRPERTGPLDRPQSTLSDLPTPTRTPSTTRKHRETETLPDPDDDDDKDNDTDSRSTHSQQPCRPIFFFSRGTFRTTEPATHDTIGHVFRGQIEPLERTPSASRRGRGGGLRPLPDLDISPLQQRPLLPAAAPAALASPRAPAPGRDWRL